MQHGISPFADGVILISTHALEGDLFLVSRQWPYSPTNSNPTAPGVPIVSDVPAPSHAASSILQQRFAQGQISASQPIEHSAPSNMLRHEAPLSLAHLRLSIYCVLKGR